MSSYLSLRIGDRLFPLSEPQVMGIVNVTPDSFYAESRMLTERAVAQRVETIRAEGGTMVDLGGYSTRHGAAFVSEEEETNRLCAALRIIRRVWPEAVVSVDTFRAAVARRCVEEFGADIINDISGGLFDTEMFSTVAALRVPYILTHLRGTPETMHQPVTYENCAAEVFREMAQRLAQLQAMGAADVILDPGFGFSKSLQDNYQLLSHLREFAVLQRPLLVGISRKTMIWRLLEITPQEALNGTTVLNTYALSQGAHILRVHDVREAVQVVRIYQAIREGGAVAHS